MSNGILICSVSPEGYQITRSSYSYTVDIPACPKGAPYTSFLVTDQKDCQIFYADLTAQGITRVPFDVTAADIVKDVFHSEQLESKGVFACKGEIPTELELHKARENRRKMLMSWVNEGDIMYSKMGTRGIQHIEDKCKRAVIELGESREWVFTADSQGKTECTNCGVMLKNLQSGLSPAQCRECGAILDASRHAAHLPAQVIAEGSSPKGRPGRPRKVAEAVA